MFGGRGRLFCHDDGNSVFLCAKSRRFDESIAVITMERRNRMIHLREGIR